MRHRAATAGVLTVLLLVAGCSSGGRKLSVKSVGASTPSTSTTTEGATSPSTPAATQQRVAKRLTDHGHNYTVTVVVDSPSTSTSALCAQVNQAGRYTVPFSLSIKNEDKGPAPLPLLGILLDDPGKVGQELAAVKLPRGPCVDFTLENVVLQPGELVGYQGSASDVTKDAVLDINLKVVPGNSPANDFIKVKLIQAEPTGSPPAAATATATVSCPATDLTASFSWQGATGSMLGGITLTNVGRTRCAIKGYVGLTFITDRVKEGVQVRQASEDVSHGEEGPPVSAPQAVVLAPGPPNTAVVRAQWFNWCGSRPLEGMTLVLIFASGGTVTANAADAQSYSPPRCDDPGSPSYVNIGPVEAGTGG